MRGEYETNNVEEGLRRELPPRARRIPITNMGEGAQAGTTSACAENTFDKPQGDEGLGNYLRVRGEYAGLFYKAMLSKELPPRARRIQLTKNHRKSLSGTTSACAENTSKHTRRVA